MAKPKTSVANFQNAISPSQAELKLNEFLQTDFNKQHFGYMPPAYPLKCSAPIRSKFTNAAIKKKSTDPESDENEY